MNEEWRVVEGHPYYEVSNLGRVLSYKQWRDQAGPRIIAGWTDKKKGYHKVQLDSAKVAVHVLVAHAFHGPRPPGLQIRHLDGNPDNNRADNLAYGTQSENQYDRVAHGTHSSSIRTHCPSGHPYNDENTSITAKGHRDCRICRRATRQRHRDKAKAALVDAVRGDA